jgi:hypothetical protein
MIDFPNCYKLEMDTNIELDMNGENKTKGLFKLMNPGKYDQGFKRSWYPGKP